MFKTEVPSVVGEGEHRVSSELAIFLFLGVDGRYSVVSTVTYV